MLNPFAAGLSNRNFGPGISGLSGAPAELDERGFIVDPAHETIDIWWGGYEYVVEWSRIDTPEKALVWLNHIGEKTWRYTTGERMLALLSACAEIHGWDLHQSV